MASENSKPALGMGTFVLAALALFGMGLIINRWVIGLGPTTGLSDGRGWGLWIGFDVLCGIALAAGAFCVAGTVYILQLKEFYPILRPTVLTGFLGYVLAGFSIIVDLGFPQRFWHMLIYWNIESPLFEVAICVMTYATVLGLEISPILFERLKWKFPLRIIRFITLPLVILGVVLSSMHQSSLGTLFVLMPHRVAPLWYSSILPILFFVSAVAAGLAMVIFESNLSTLGLKHRLENRLLAKIGRIIPFVLGLYLALRIADMVALGNHRYLFTGGSANILFWIEILAGFILPMVLFSLPSVRRNPAQIFAAAVLVIVGLVLNRFNISMINFNGGAYIPSWQEMMITIGLVSVGALVFTLASHFLPVFTDPHSEGKPSESKPAEQPAPQTVDSEELKSVPAH